MKFDIIVIHPQETSNPARSNFLWQSSCHNPGVSVNNLPVEGTLFILEIKLKKRNIVDDNVFEINLNTVSGMFTTKVVPLTEPTSPPPSTSVEPPTCQTWARFKRLIFMFFKISTQCCCWHNSHPKPSTCAKTKTNACCAPTQSCTFVQAYSSQYLPSAFGSKDVIVLAKVSDDHP